MLDGFLCRQLKRTLIYILYDLLYFWLIWQGGQSGNCEEPFGVPAPATEYVFFVAPPYLLSHLPVLSDSPTPVIECHSVMTMGYAPEGYPSTGL